MNRHVPVALAAIVCLRAAGAIAPALPREYVDTTLPVQTGALLEAAASCSDLQAKIDAANAGDTVVIPAGVTCTGNYVLRAKPAAPGWIVIRTSAITQLPGAGRRITPGQASLLPKMVAARSFPVIRTEPGAHHYRLIGLEITAPESLFIDDLVTLGDGSPAQNTLAQAPADLVIDRCYIHGSPHQKVKRGIALNSARSAIIDSYISEIHNTEQDSQAIAGWNGPGPYKIVNNFLSASTENIQFGGSDVFIPNLVPSDIEIRQNHFFKPLSWKAGDASYAGEAWVMKDLFELKNARRVLLEGNVFDQSLRAFAILFTVRAESDRVPWAVVEDVTFRGNLVRHAGDGIDFLGRDDVSTTGFLQRIRIEDNVFEDIDGARWDGNGLCFLMVQGPPDIAINHNTTLQSSNVVFGDNPPAARFAFTNNIATGDIGGYSIGAGDPALNAYFPDAVVAGNLFARSRTSSYPAGNYFPATSDEVGFIDPANGNYRLAANSPYSGKGTDGKDPGANIDAVEQLAAAALGGTASSVRLRPKQPREPLGPIR